MGHSITNPLIEDIINALDADVRFPTEGALRQDGPKVCVRRWFLEAANDRAMPEDRMIFAKWACQVIQAAVHTRHTF